MKHLLAFAMLLVLVACGKHTVDEPVVENNFAPGGDFVVRARASFGVTTDMSGRAFVRASATQPVNVTMAAHTNFAIDNSKFIIPAITNASLDFGSLAVTTLSDNNLKVCGAGGNTKCTTAILRMYTTGVAGAGLWNTVDAYGAPMTAALTTPLTVGLNAAGAAIMQTFTIPPGKRVVRLSDFTTTPKYNIKFDFTDAGVGAYSTTIVVEYALQ